MTKNRPHVRETFSAFKLVIEDFEMVTSHPKQTYGGVGPGYLP